MTGSELIVPYYCQVRILGIHLPDVVISTFSIKNKFVTTWVVITKIGNIISVNIEN